MSIDSDLDIVSTNPGWLHIENLTGVAENAEKSNEKMSLSCMLSFETKQQSKQRKNKWLKDH